ncbi:hypothetical protein [Runella limosa]|jgi:hypothetical protein|uniref:hypothetical protein n=1 Tax=Runella limosa TaxID=370978 RepID=UPI00041E4AF4|nr:hypothetical protein [Runella limosa]
MSETAKGVFVNGDLGFWGRLRMSFIDLFARNQRPPTSIYSPNEFKNSEQQSNNVQSNFLDNSDFIIASTFSNAINNAITNKGRQIETEYNLNYQSLINEKGVIEAQKTLNLQKIESARKIAKQNQESNNTTTIIIYIFFIVVIVSLFVVFIFKNK